MIRLRSLGQCVIEVGDVRLTPAAETLFATALYLVVEGPRPIDRRELLDLVWADAKHERAQHCLRQVLYKLRALGGPVRADGSCLVVSARSLATDYSPLVTTPDDASLETLADAAPGTFLPGYAPRFSEPFAQWVDRQRDMVNGALRRALVSAIGAKKERGDWPLVERLAKRCLEIDPLNEEATLAVAEAAAVNGSKAQALGILDRYLREIGPQAREIRVPASLLRRRISESPYAEARRVRETPFVGRDHELGELNRALALARQSQGSTHLWWGEPGIGKTRLVTEFTRAAELQRVQVVRVGCQSSDERRPLSAFVDLVPALLALPGSIGCSPESLHYLKRLTQHDSSAATSAGEAGEGETVFARIRMALFDLLDAIAAEECLILVMEDVHWLDRMSWEVVAELSQWIATRAGFAILTSRSPYAPAVGESRSRSDLQERLLAPLEDSVCDDIARSLLPGSHREDDERRGWCARMCGGNPYFLIELAHNASKASGSYRPPPSLFTLIHYRLHRLQSPARRSLQACAILGRYSTLERLEAVLGERRIDLLDALDELERYALISTDKGEVRICHSLLGDAVLGSASKSTLAILHRHAALRLEGESQTTQSTALLWEGAEHWQLAGEGARAVVLLRECAQHAGRLGLPDQVVATLDRADAIATGLPDKLANAEVRLTALRRTQAWSHVLEAVTQLRRLRNESAAETHHDDLELVAHEARWMGQCDVGALFDQVRACATSPAAPAAHRLAAGVICMMLADNLCLAAEAGAIYESIVGEPGYVNLSETARLHLDLIYHCAFGDPHRAVEAAGILVERAKLGGDPAECVKYIEHASLAYRFAGDTETAQRVAREAMAMAKEHGLVRRIESAANQLMAIELWRGNVDDAERIYNEVERVDEANQFYRPNVTTLGHAMEIAIKRRRFESARSTFAILQAEIRGLHMTRATARCASLQCQLLLAEKNPLPKSLLHELWRLHLATRASNAADHCAAAMCQSLVKAGRATEACTLLSEYLTVHRRPGLSLSSDLRLALEAAGLQSPSGAA